MADCMPGDDESTKQTTCVRCDTGWMGEGRRGEGMCEVMRTNE